MTTKDTIPAVPLLYVVKLHEDSIINKRCSQSFSLYVLPIKNECGTVHEHRWGANVEHVALRLLHLEDSCGKIIIKQQICESFKHFNLWWSLHCLLQLEQATVRTPYSRKIWWHKAGPQSSNKHLNYKTILTNKVAPYCQNDHCSLKKSQKHTPVTPQRLLALPKNSNSANTNLRANSSFDLFPELL